MQIKLLTVIVILFSSPSAFASGINFNDTTLQAAPLDDPHFTGNVGIGSVNPTQVLDVAGTTRATNFTVTSISSGNQCLEANGAGVVSGTGSACAAEDETWVLAGGAGNVGITNAGSVGIGTTSGIGGGLIVMNGNVGIGTWNPSDFFQVGKYTVSSKGFEVANNGNAGIAETTTTSAALSVMNGNVGIGTWISNSALTIIPSDGASFLQGEGRSVSWHLSDDGSGDAIIYVTTGDGVILTSSDNQILGAEGYPQATDTGAGFEVSAGSGAYEGILGINSSGQGLMYIENLAGGNGSVDIGAGDGSTWEKIKAGSAVIGATYAQSEIAPPTNGMLVQGDVGIGTYNIAATLDVLGSVAIGATTNSKFVTTTPPDGGMIISGNVGIGSYAPVGGLIVKGGNVGIGSLGVNPNFSLVVNNVNGAATVPYAGTGVCWGANGCIGYCTAGGAYPSCTTCICL